MSTSEASVLPIWIAREDEVPKEYREILVTLPREKGWAEPYLYQYQGFWHPGWQFQNAIDCQRKFLAQDTDVLVGSSPKCGTTWLKALAFAIINRIHYPLTDKQHPLISKNPHELVPFLELDVDFDKQIPRDWVTPSGSRRVFASHLPYISLPESAKDSECKLIYICRNPKDALVSLWHFMNRLRPLEMGNNSLEEAFDMFSRGISLYGPIWDHVLQYWNESLERPNKILFLKYEEMRKDPILHIKHIAKFIGCPLSEEEEASAVADKIASLCSFNNLSNLEVNKSGKDWSGMEFKVLFRQGKVDDWKNYLTPDMVDSLNRLTADKFRGSGLEL